MWIDGHMRILSAHLYITSLHASQHYIHTFRPTVSVNSLLKLKKHFYWPSISLVNFWRYWGNQNLPHSPVTSPAVRHITGLWALFLGFVCIIAVCFCPSVLWRCWLGGRKGIRPVKNWVWGAGMVICYLEWGADLHLAQVMPLPLTVSSFSKIQIGFTFLVLAHPGSPRQRAVKRVCVCIAVCFACTEQKVINACCAVEVVGLCICFRYVHSVSAIRPAPNDSSYRNSRAFSSSVSFFSISVLRYTTIRDAILTCARKPT